MFEPVKKIALLCCLAAGFALLPAASSYAEINIDVQSAADFARTHGGGEYADVLDNLGTDEILCGDKNTKCSSATQVCLKCTYSMSTTTMGMVPVTTTSHYEYGKCVSKSSLNANNLQASWGGDENCPSTVKTMVGSTIFPGELTIETTGFLSENSTSMLFWTVREGHEFSDSEGRKYKLYTDEGNATIQYASSKEYKGCEVLPVKIYNMRGCFYCPLASLVFRAANDVTAGAFKFFGFAFKHVIAVVFVVWLALAALGQAFPMTKQDAPKFFAAILKQGFKFMLAFFLLANSGQLFSYFVSPLLQGGLEMGKGIQTVKGTDLSDEDLERLLPKIKEVSPGNQYYNIGADLTKNGKGGLYYKIRDYLIVLQTNLSVMQAIGTTLFCVGSHKMGFLDIINGEFLNGMRMMFLGGLLTVFAFLLGMSFAFYFLDGLLQLAIIGAMMPLMIAGWPFKVTAQYASTGFKMLLNTFFVMFFTGFVVSVDLELVNQSLAYSQKAGTQKIEGKQKETNAGAISKQETSAGFNAIIEAANEQNWEKMKDATNIGGSGFLILAFCCIFGFKFVTQVTPLAGKLSAGGFSKGGIAGKIGTMAASSVKGMATKAARPVGQALADQYHDAGGLVGIVGDSAKTLGTVAGAIGSVAKEAGDKVAAKGERMVARGGFVGKAVGLALKEAGTVTGDMGSAAKGVGKGVAAVGGGVSKVSKKLHQPYRSK